MVKNDVVSAETGWRASPYVVAVPFCVIIYALSARSSGLGAAGLPLGAVIGMGWVLLLGLIVRRVRRRAAMKDQVEDALVFCAVIATAFLLCGGIMAMLLISGALNEPSTPYSTLSALMFRTVPYFIVTNSLMELFIMPGMVFFGWRPGLRRMLILGATATYFAMRIWTYLVYAEQRLRTATGPLSAEDVRWYRDTLVTDYRPVLIAVTLVLCLMAAFLPAWPWAQRRVVSRPTLR